MSERIASYAVSENLSRGRVFSGPAHRYRSAFDRDRDRIIHSSAFRRLEGKTQVFTPGLDDHYRSRFTHSVEVSQIGRTIAKALKLNESLTEAICLAHDLGHSPFGHAGEKVLDGLMADFGGFEHNRQSLRIVDMLEHPYPDFAGLNLMYETRLGLAKHHSPYDINADVAFPELSSCLEGQVADLADRIAYNCHDLEDGLRAGLIVVEQLGSIEIFAEAGAKIKSVMIEDKSVRYIRTAKAIIDLLVSDCIEASKEAIRKANIESIEDVYDMGKNLIVFSDVKKQELLQLEGFLLENFYLHPTLVETTEKVKVWVSELFGIFCDRPEQMAGFYRKIITKDGLERAVCDYISGMTDRYCLQMLGKI